MAGLSLATGVAVVRSIESLNIEGLELKWPNDVLCSGRKLAGILIEIAGDVAGPCEAVIGIGLNVSNNSTDNRAVMDSVEQPWTDLSTQVSGDIPLSRNWLVAEIVRELLDMLTVFASEGFRPFQQRYSDYDALKGKDVCVQLGERRISGQARGIDEKGGLLLYTNGKVEALTSGDVSVRVSE
jgi:BirA family biotin operon repressor/biotin-[acetyl-CoA-carboxylase] ligase